MKCKLLCNGKRGLFKGKTEFLLELFKVKSLAKPQPEHDIFLRSAAISVKNGSGALYIFGKIPFVKKSFSFKKRMSRRAESEIFLVTPIFKIVAAFKAGLREIRNFILHKAVLLKKLAGIKIAFGAKILVAKGQLAFLLQKGKTRSLLDLQNISRNMTHPEGGGKIHRPLKAFPCLKGNSEHKVERYVLKALRLCKADGLAHLFGRMAAPQKFKLVFAGRLHTHRQAVYPTAAQPFEKAGYGFARVRFDRYFGRVVNRKDFPCGAYKPTKKVGGKFGRRSPSEIECVGRLTSFAKTLHVTQNGGGIVLCGL